MLNEADIIARLKGHFPTHIGDDAAVIPGTNNQNYIITKDLLVEDVHFRASYCDAASLAHKALHVNLSDLAAMGATPQFVLGGIAIPLAYGRYGQDFLDHFVYCCQKAGTILIGGDTTTSPDKLFLSVTAIGTAQPHRIKYRHTAKDGDLICVVGHLGAAHIGLSAFEQSLEGFDHYKNAFLRPNAKIDEGKWLGAQTSVTSMMDISDGLFIDLKRLCHASHVAGTIDLEKLQVPHPDYISVCTSLTLDPTSVALMGGEDYGLLFTIDRAHHDVLCGQFAQTFGYPIYCIGHISQGNGVHLREHGAPKNLPLTPFSHFGERT